jgi:hypothetical protein
VGKPIVEGDNEILKVGLLELIVKHWPELADK